MGCCITKRTCPHIAERTAMCLGVIFDKFQSIFTTDVTHQLSVSTSTIQMNDHDGFCAWSDESFNLGIINLQGVDIRLYQYGGKSTFCNGQY